MICRRLPSTSTSTSLSYSRNDGNSSRDRCTAFSRNIGGISSQFGGKLFGWLLQSSILHKCRSCRRWCVLVGHRGQRRHNSCWCRCWCWCWCCRWRHRRICISVNRATEFCAISTTALFIGIWALGTVVPLSGDSGHSLRRMASGGVGDLLFRTVRHVPVDRKTGKICRDDADLQKRTCNATASFSSSYM